MRIALTLLIISHFLGIALYAQVNLANGLVAHYPFNGNALDASGNNHHGVPGNGVRLTTDRLGTPNSAFEFDGIDDVITIADAANLFSTPHFSMVIWFRTASNSLQNLVAKRDFGLTNGTQYQFFINYPPFPGIGSNVVSDQNPCPTGVVSVTSYTNTGENICIGRWYCAVVIFDGLTHRIYINGQLRRSVPAGFNSMAQCGSELRFGNWWSGDLLPFNGAMDDIRWYNRSLTADEIALLSAGSGQPQFVNADFTSRPADGCATDRFSFQAVGTGLTTYNWDFGDGQTASGFSPIQHQYVVPGQYRVRLVTGSGGGCLDTAQKIIDTRVSRGNLLANPDTVVCAGTSLSIRSSVSTALQCVQVNGQSFVGAQAPPLSNVTVDTRVVAVGRSLGPNLVVNGDFNSGNTGFTSQYTFSASQSANRQFGIVSAAANWSASVTCQDCGGFPLQGGGNFLIASAASETGIPVWGSTVNVSPNTQYQVQFSGIAFDAQPAGRLECFINNRPAGYWIADSGTGRWSTFTADWNSGSATSLNISIVNAASSSGGNRFGIDQLSVRTYQTILDSFQVRIIAPSSIQVSPDSTICPGQSLSLSVSGGTGYLWSPAAGLSNTGIGNPVASPLVSTIYRVRAMTATGCEAVDSVLVTVLETPAIDLIADTSLCAGSSINLLASGASSYSWTPAVGLSNTTIASPTASPVQTTRYRVRFTESTGCTGDDSVLVTVNAVPVINASADAEICAGERTNLQVTGGVSYFWFPAVGLSSTSSPNPVASPALTTRYYVQGFGPGQCFSFDSVLVRVGDTPVLSVRSDTVICQGSSLVLNASGASRYEWTPAGGLSDPTSASTLVSPLSTTIYTVTGFGSTGCSTSRSVRVSVGADAGRIYIPNAFTPNGDGLNDCVQVNGGGAATVYEFAIFNRFGERVFFSRTPGECWDGTYRGQQQPAGTFAYYFIVDSPCGPAKLKGNITLIR